MQWGEGGMGQRPPHPPQHRPPHPPQGSPQ
jgi:hypothetical protein